MANGSFRGVSCERDTDSLPDGELLIDVAYSSLNYKDGLSATGNPGVTRNFPHTPGIDAAGTVAESSSEGFSPGDEVIVIGFDLGMNTSGGYGQKIRGSGGVGGADAGRARCAFEHDTGHGGVHGGAVRAQAGAGRHDSRRAGRCW